MKCPSKINPSTRSQSLIKSFTSYIINHLHLAGLSYSLKRILLHASSPMMARKNTRATHRSHKPTNNWWLRVIKNSTHAQLIQCKDSQSMETRPCYSTLHKKAYISKAAQKVQIATHSNSKLTPTRKNEVVPTTSQKVVHQFK